MGAKNGPGTKRKRSLTEPKRHPTSFWLDDETLAALERLVTELNLNRSAVVREALRRMVSEDQSTEVRRLVAELQHVVTGGRTS